MFVDVAADEQRALFQAAVYTTLAIGGVLALEERALSWLPLSEFVDWRSAVLIVPSTTKHDEPKSGLFARSSLLKRLANVNSTTLFAVRGAGRFIMRHHLHDVDCKWRSARLVRVK